MLPELFRIAGLDMPIYTYGVLLTIAFLASLSITTRLAVKNEIPKSRVYDLAMYIIPSALIGTRLLMISASPQEMISYWQRLLSFDLLHSIGHYMGGFLAALAVSAILMRVWHLPWGKIADAFAPGLTLGNAIGRLGCFAAGCCWGKPTASRFGVRFTPTAHEMNGVPINAALVPTQLIEAGANLAIFAFLLWLWKRRFFHGQIMLAYMMLYALERFTVEFWRGDPRGQIMSLSTAQFISAIMFPLAMILYCWLLNQAIHKSGASYYAQ